MIKKYTLEVSGKAPAYIKDKELEYIYDHAAGERKENGFREYNRHYTGVSDYHELWFKTAPLESLVGEYIIDLVAGNIIEVEESEEFFVHIYTNKGVYQPTVSVVDCCSTIVDFSNSKVLTCKYDIEKGGLAWSPRDKIIISTTSGDIFIRGRRHYDQDPIIGFREHKY